VGTDAHDARTTGIHSWVRDVAAAHAGDLAVHDDAHALSYAELDGRSCSLAHRLRALGVRPGARVGICRDRSAASVVGALGTFYAGGAYVGLDPAYPVARLDYMLRDADVSVLLTHASLTARFARVDVPVIDLDDLDAIGTAEHPPDCLATADDIAYVIYTSGSTGEPKGVEVAHRNLRSLITWHHDAFGVRATDRASVLASPAFDASVWEVWPYLTAGASLHIPDAATTRSSPALRDWLVSTRITIAFVATPMLETLLDVDWSPATELRFVLTGGDVLRRRPPSNLPFVVVNNYGVTEATVVSTSGPVAPGDGTGDRPSIGRAIAGTQLYVLDDEGRPVPSGDAGELFIGGASVAAGYLGRPEATAERFLADPFHTEPAARLYRTGDVVRIAANGDVHFLGRLDEQVQIRGHRVELEEVATALMSHPAVGQCVIVASENDQRDRRLVAYLVPNGSAPPDRAELRDHLATWLPAYMIPAAFVTMDALPVTSNGKVDRDALPPPPASARHSAKDRGADASSIETTVVEMLEDLLELESVRRDDDFFELGGHSLMGAQLVARLEDQFDVEIDLLTIFDNPTAAGIALVVSDQLVVESGDSTR
jgi:amino acid adenylation domain-containing protein